MDLWCYTLVIYHLSLEQHWLGYLCRLEQMWMRLQWIWKGQINEIRFFCSVYCFLSSCVWPWGVSVTTMCCLQCHNLRFHEQSDHRLLQFCGTNNRNLTCWPADLLKTLKKIRLDHSQFAWSCRSRGEPKSDSKLNVSSRSYLSILICLKGEMLEVWDLKMCGVVCLTEIQYAL